MAKKKRSNIRCFEKLDTADVNKRFLEYRKKEDQEFPEEEFMYPPSQCEYTDPAGNVITVTKTEVGYVKTKQKRGSLFGEYRCYFMNGNIQKSGQYYYQSFNCGIWREYDMKGYLIKETDMDKPYKNYSWQKVLDFVKKRNIDLYDERTSIDRYINEENIPCWNISWFNKRITLPRYTIIDARNGRIITDGIAHGMK
ncbi:MAG: hypothetical protein ACFNM7_12615 [Prevotella conceptionensis]